MGTTSKKYELYGGIILVWDVDITPFRYHDSSRVEEPTATLYFHAGSDKLNQPVLDKAARRVMQTRAVMTRRQIQLSTRGRVSNWTEAVALCDTFCEELEKLLRERDKVVAFHRGAKSGARSDAYHNHPARGR